jgi:enoyl-CoA hydratase/carnithine racemase
LTALCGRPVALRLILGAEVLTGEEAVKLGLAQWNAPRAELAQAAEAIARRYASLPAHAAAAAKFCILSAEHRSPVGYEREAQATMYLMKTAQTRRLIEAFLERPQ